MIKLFKNLIRKSFNIIGLDVVRISQCPGKSLLGLKSLPFKTIIDIGANEGQFAKSISNIFPAASIYCFEPLPSPFKKLKDWALSKNGKVSVFNTALGDKEGDINMFYHNEHSPSSSFLQSTEICHKLYPFTKEQTSIKVRSTALDKAIDNLSVPICPEILIKVDVQGYEAQVIRGGKETFKKAQACILEINLDILYRDQATFEEILFLLNELGYRYAGNLDQVYSNKGKVLYINAIFIK